MCYNEDRKVVCVLAKTKTSSAVKQRYNEKAYARLAITIPKGQKAAVEAHAQSKGESVNSLINGLLRADMGLTESAWRTQKYDAPEGS
jgi:hypothetical protein